jgi:thiol-disulfide isomerase/thioredoxin
VSKVTSTNPARKGPANRPTTKKRVSKGGRRLPLVGVVVVVVVVVLVGAVIITAATRKKGAVAANVEQNRPVSVVGSALPTYDDSGADPAVGNVAPVVHGESFDGTKETVGGKTAKPTLVMFVAHWCPHCRAEVPRVVKWRADGTIPADINLVAVSTDVNPSYPNYPPSSWLDDVKWPGTTVADDAPTTAGQAYGLSAFPFFVGLDANGKVVQRGTGELDQAAVEQLVQKLQAS